MRKILVMLLCLVLSGCAYTKLSCKKLLSDMYSKNILAENEYNQIRMKMAPALYKISYGKWIDTFNTYKGDAQEKKVIFSKLVAYIEEWKENELDGMANYCELIQDAYRRKKLTKEEYEQENKMIKGNEYFIKSIDYQNVLAYFKLKAQDKDASDSEKSIYVKMYNFTLGEYKKTIIRQYNTAIFWQSFAAGLQSAGASMSQQSYRPQTTYYRTYQPSLITQPMNTPSSIHVVPQVSGSNQYTVNSIGSFDYVSGSNGYSGSGQKIGDFYYYNDDKGGSYTGQSIGNFDYISGSGSYSGTGQKIGNFYYYNDNKGGSYTAQKIGQFDYISGSGGYSGTGQKIGNFYYYNDNE